METPIEIFIILEYNHLHITDIINRFKQAAANASQDSNNFKFYDVSVLMN